MGSTNKTSNYELSQFLGSDKPAWLLDYNGDMLKIDTQMKANADAASAAQSKADTADGKADDLRTDLTTLNNQVNDPTGLAADVATLAGTMNTVTSLIGNGEPTTTDKTLIGAINELDADKGDMSNLNTTNKSSLVAAINEANANNVLGSVEVVTDGTKTYAQELNALAALVDFTKIRSESVFEIITSGGVGLYRVIYFTDHSASFTRVNVASNTISFDTYVVSNDSKVYEGRIATSDGTFAFDDYSSTTVASGRTYKIVY